MVNIGGSGLSQTGNLNGSCVRDPVAGVYSLISRPGFVRPCARALVSVLAFVLPDRG